LTNHSWHVNICLLFHYLSLFRLHEKCISIFAMKVELIFSCYDTYIIWNGLFCFLFLTRIFFIFCVHFPWFIDKRHHSITSLLLNVLSSIIMLIQTYISLTTNEFVNMHEEIKSKRDATHGKKGKFKNKVGNIHRV
jgi:hypothetical protein